MKGLRVVEMCAGAGGQALGLEQAGFEHAALIEIDKRSCETLKLNRPHWNVIEGDLAEFDGQAYEGVDLLAGGLPCPPFSVAGKQLGKGDERNLFPVALRLTAQMRPKVLMIENVRGILDPIFADYRRFLKRELRSMGYEPAWNLLNASDYGVPQLRPRVVLVAVAKDHSGRFSWPVQSAEKLRPVGDVLFDLMASNGWKGAAAWRKRANDIAPTIVGGSLKHGGPDLGPTRARRAWAGLGVDGLGIADEPPAPEFVGMPKLTVRMVARLQGFPDEWQFSGRKTSAYRQVGNAFPPPVARAVAAKIRECLTSEASRLTAA